MTPEQREELKQAALKATPGKWDSDETRVYYPNMAGGFCLRQSPNPEANAKYIAAASPAVVLSLIAQVEALTVPQWQPIETAPQDGYMLVHEDGAIRAKLRFNGEWQHVAYPAIIGQWGDAIVGEDAKRLLPAGCRLEMRDGCCEEPTHWKPMDSAPTIPAIPGTKEGA